jgi:hypothetical protein
MNGLGVQLERIAWNLARAACPTCHGTWVAPLRGLERALVRCSRCHVRESVRAILERGAVAQSRRKKPLRIRQELAARRRAEAA